MIPSDQGVATRHDQHLIGKAHFFYCLLARYESLKNDSFFKTNHSYHLVPTSCEQKVVFGINFADGYWVWKLENIDAGTCLCVPLSNRAVIRRTVNKQFGTLESIHSVRVANHRKQKHLCSHVPTRYQPIFIRKKHMFESILKTSYKAVILLRRKAG